MSEAKGRLATKRIFYSHSPKFLTVLQILAIKDLTTSVHGCSDNQRIVEGGLKVASQHDRLGVKSDRQRARDVE